MRPRHQIADPYVEARIRESLAAGADEPPALELPQLTPAEDLQRWKIEAVKARSTPTRRSRITRGHMPSQDTLHALEAAREGWN